MEQLKEEIAVFKELGLDKQVSLREIQAEIDGMEYYPVTMRDLEKLFGMRLIHLATAWANIKAAAYHSPVLGIGSVFFISVVVGLFGAGIGNILWGHPGFGAALCFGGSFASLAAIAMTAFMMDELRTKLVASLVTEPIRFASIKIPYGAALRYKEALEKGVFESFEVIYPNVVEQKIAKDPAIVGLKQGQMYMIVFWDIAKDRERVIRKIKDFQKFKVQG